MTGKEHRLLKTDAETGGMIAEEERIRKGNVMTGSKVALETTEMKENLGTVVTVETSEITVTGERLETPGRAVRLEILVTIETLKTIEIRRIHALRVILMTIEKGTTVSPIGKMISMMNAATEEVMGEMILQDRNQEMILGMTPVMNPEAKPGMIVMAEHEVALQTLLKKVVGELEALRWTAAAAVTTTTGIPGAVTQNARDMTTVNKGEIPHLIVDMVTESDVRERGIRGRHPQHTTEEGMMMNEKKGEMSVE